MKGITVWVAACALVFTAACGGDDAKDATKGLKDKAAEAAGSAKDAANSAANSATDAAKAAADAAAGTAGAAKDAAKGMADSATGSAKGVAAGLGGGAVESCRTLAKTQAWGKALEVCKKAHEMMPDDLELEHAYQQAQAAAGQ